MVVTLPSSQDQFPCTHHPLEIHPPNSYALIASVGYHWSGIISGTILNHKFNWMTKCRHISKILRVWFQTNAVKWVLQQSKYCNEVSHNLFGGKVLSSICKDKTKNIKNKTKKQQQPTFVKHNKPRCASNLLRVNFLPVPGQYLINYLYLHAATL